MTPEEFALIKREELTEAGRELYDREVERRSRPEWAALQARKEAEREAGYAKRLEAEEKALTGIAGWLTLPALGLILSPLLYGFDLWQALSLPGSEREAVASLVSFKELADVVFIVATVVVALFFFGKRRPAPKLVIGLLLLQLALFITEYLVADSTGRIAPSYMGTLMANVGRGVLVCMIWIPYFMFSKRVKLTFVVDSREGQLPPDADAVLRSLWQSPKCQRCGQLYPSPYYFKLFRTSEKVTSMCNACYEGLGESEKQAEGVPGIVGGERRSGAFYATSC